MTILTTTPAEFNPSTAFALAPTAGTPADLAELSADLGGWDAIPDDSEAWDVRADESLAMDRLDAGLLPW